MGISTDAQNQEAFPAWADAALSDELPRIIGVGEAQAVEFKSQYPAQASDLGKEIAAFAASNNGRIIVGVGDGGDILGLEECRTQRGRAKIVSRVEGLCANGIRPSVTPDIRFALVEVKPLLVIDVAKGSAPIYYSKSIPYLRQITAARPMTPDEVIDHIVAWKKEDEAAANTPKSRYLGQLAGLLASAEITARE